MKKINNKAIIAALAISIGAASAAPEKLFSVRDVTTNTQLLAHGGLPGNCATHAQQLAKMQAAKDAKKKSKKKAKTSAVKARVSAIDNEDSDDENLDDEDLDDEDSGDPDL